MFGMLIWQFIVYMKKEVRRSIQYPDFPSSIVNDAVCRKKLKAILSQNKNSFLKLEAVVHPLVAKDRAEFIRNAKANILVFDIPLLFETNGDKHMDAVACVYIDEETQKKTDTRSRDHDRRTVFTDSFKTNANL